MRYQVVDMKTGKIIRETAKKTTAFEETYKEITKDMMLEASDELLSYLYREMKRLNKIDMYGMVKVDGLYISQEFFRIGAESGYLAENLLRLKLSLSFRGFIKKTSTTDCKSWIEVMEVLGIDKTNNRKIKAMKKLLVDNDIVREATKINGNFILL